MIRFTSPPSAVVFDLDGTLIDSADAIMQGWQQVLDAFALPARVEVSRDLVGPPLRQTLTLLSGVDDRVMLDAMVAHFIAWYDREGALASAPYPGIPEMLRTLRDAGCVLHIVTNKRLAPTRLILDHLGWSDLFQRVDTQDMRPEALLDGKAAVIARLIAETGLNVAQAVYVGDRLEDQRAAARSGLDCIIVDWGYGRSDVLPPEVPRVGDPEALLALLALR